MSIYGKVPDSLKSCSEHFLVRGEEAEASKPVLHEGKMYYEIIYSPKVLWIKSRSIKGIVIVDEEGNRVKDKKTLMELVRLFYYYSIFFDNRIIDLKATVKNDIQLEKEEEDYRIASSALDYFISEGVNGAGEVKGVIDRYPAMRKSSNDVLKSILDKTNNYELNNTVFSAEVLRDIEPLYNKVMMMNFERVKFINTASSYYDDIRAVIVKKKKSVKFFTDTKLKNALNKLENIMGFFINVLKYYGSLINYSNERYSRYLKENNEKNIEISFNMIRND